eukprot:761519-Hanusia_phi.AAC.1
MQRTPSAAVKQIKRAFNSTHILWVCLVQPGLIRESAELHAEPRQARQTQRLLAPRVTYPALRSRYRGRRFITHAAVPSP